MTAATAMERAPAATLGMVVHNLAALRAAHSVGMGISAAVHIMEGAAIVPSAVTHLALPGPVVAVHGAVTRLVLSGGIIPYLMLPAHVVAMHTCPAMTPEILPGFRAGAVSGRCMIPALKLLLYPIVMIRHTPTVIRIMAPVPILPMFR